MIGDFDVTVIDATNLVLGRLSSVVAKKLLNGEKVDIVNAEKCVIVGGKKGILAKYAKRLELAQKGDPELSPKYPKHAHMIIKRTIRGMLTYKKTKGREAFERLRVHLGFPKELAGKELEAIDTAKFNGKEAFITVGELGKELGA